MNPVAELALIGKKIRFLCAVVERDDDAGADGIGQSGEQLGFVQFLVERFKLFSASELLASKLFFSWSFFAGW